MSRPPIRRRVRCLRVQTSFPGRQMPTAEATQELLRALDEATAQLDIATEDF